MVNSNLVYFLWQNTIYTTPVFSYLGNIYFIRNQEIILIEILILAFISSFAQVSSGSWIYYLQLKLAIYGTILFIMLLFYWCVHCSSHSNKIGLKAKTKKCCFLSLWRRKNYFYSRDQRKGSQKGLWQWSIRKGCPVHY